MPAKALRPRPLCALGSRLVGHWSLVSFETVSGGRVECPFGPGAVGEITYDAAGHVAVQIMKTGRSLFASGDQAAGTVEEVSAAFTGYVAYYGTYSADERASVVTHHLAASMFGQSRSFAAHPQWWADTYSKERGNKPCRPSHVRWPSILPA
jgi:hypothetical protein